MDRVRVHGPLQSSKVVLLCGSPVALTGVPPRQSDLIFAPIERSPVEAHDKAVADHELEVDFFRFGLGLLAAGSGAGSSFFGSYPSTRAANTAAAIAQLSFRGAGWQ